MTAIAAEAAPHESVASYFNGWLTAEAVNACGGRNAYLNDLAANQAALRLPIGSPGNIRSAKAFSHHSRYGLWTKAAEEGALEDDRLAAKMVFGALMFAAGTQRLADILLATDQRDYAARRIAGSRCELVDDAVASVMVDIGMSFSEAPDSPPVYELIKHSDTVNELVLDTHLEIIQAVADRELPVQPDDDTLAMLEHAHIESIGLAVAHIVFAGELRNGELARVPVLGPHSITDAVIEYPFKTGEQTS